MNYYFCKACCQITTRDSKNKKIHSFCSVAEKNVMLTRIDDVDVVAGVMWEKFAPTIVNMDGKKTAQKMLLEHAFRMGAIRMFNMIKNGVVKP